MKQKGFALIPTLITLGIVAIASIGGFFGLDYAKNYIEDKTSMAVGTSINFVGGQAYYLSGSGVTATDTSIALVSFTDPNGTELTMTDFGDIGYATLEPGTSRQEFISFTGITQASDSSRATLTGVTRGLRFVSPYTQDTSLRKAHTGASILIVSNSPQLYNQLARKGGTESITGVYTYASTSAPVYDADWNVGTTSNAFAHAAWINRNFGDLFNGNTWTGAQTFNGTTTFAAAGGAVWSQNCSASTDLCNKAYVDGVAISGASNADTTTKGIVEEATVAEINSSATTGGTGAKLFMTPASFAVSNFASSTTAFYSATSTTNTSPYLIVPMVAGNKLVVNYSIFGDTGSGNPDPSFTFRQSTDAATTTLASYTNIAAANGSVQFVHTATTTIDLHIGLNVASQNAGGGAVYNSITAIKIPQ
jgi:type II secretory pathway pseudopilin PulG